MANFYVTYSLGSDLCNCYSVVKAENYNKARDLIDKKTFGKFAFVYGEKDFAGQPEKYGLREVPLQAQMMLD